MLRRILFTCLACVCITTAPHAQSTIKRASPDGLIETYSAYIGPHDIFNSDGVRLTKPWQIIRQDRANFHLFRKRDLDDRTDSFFAIKANREAMERMLARGSISADAARAITRGDVWVEVEIYGRGNTGEWIDVTVSD